MKPIARRLLLGLAALALVALLAAGVLLLPPVQRALAERVLRGAVPGEVALGSLSAGPGGVVAGDVALGLAPAHVALARAEVKLDWGALLLRREIVVRSLVVQGLVADLTRPDPSHQPKPLKGVVAEVPPTAFSLDGLDLSGRVILAPGQELALAVTGGGYGPGRAGALEVVASLGGPRPVEARLAVGLEPDASGALAGITAKGPVTLLPVSGSPGASVNLDLASRRGETAETLAVALSLAGSPTPFARISGTFDPAVPSLGAEVRLAAGAAESALAEAFAGRDLPAGRLAGDGTLSYNLATGATGLRLSLEGAIEEPMGSIPAADLALQVDASLAGGVADVRALALDLRARGTSARVSARALRPFRWDPAVGPKGLPAEELVAVELAAVPLAWAGVPGLAGELRDAAFSAEVRDGALLLSHLRPAVVVIDRLDDPSGAALARGLTVSTGLEATLAGEAFKARLGPVQVDDSTGRVATFEATARGVVGTAPSLGHATLSGDVDLARLAAQPAAASVPRAVVAGMGATLDLAVAPGPGRLAVERGVVAVARGSEAPLLRLELAPRAWSLADPAGSLRETLPIATVTLDRLPLGLANPFLPPGLAVAEGLASGTLAVSGSPAGIVASSVASPLVVSGLAVEDGSGPLLAGADLTLSLEATAPADGLPSVTVPSLRLSSGGRDLLAVVATAAPQGGSIGLAVEADADLGALGSQPLGARLGARPTAGTLRAQVAASIPAEGTALPRAKVELMGRGLALGPDNAFPRLALSAELAPSANASAGSTVRVAFDLESPRGKSDLRLDGDLRGAPGALAANLVATSAFLSVPDLQALAGLAPSGGDEASADKPAGTGSAPLPPWAGLEGQVAATLAAVALPGGARVEAVKARVVLTPAAAELAEFTGRFGQDPFSLSARLGFDATRPLAYDLAGRVAVDRLDAAKLVPPARPGIPALVEGLFSVKGSFTAAAPTPAGLAMALRGELAASSTGGKVHPMAGLSNDRPRAANLAGAGLGLAGALLGRGGDTAAGPGRLESVLALFREIPYDRFDALLRRDDGPVELEQLQLTGPEIRLVAAGRLDLDPARPWSQQPLQLPMRLLAKGKAAYLLDQGSLLTGRRTDDGWYEGPTYVQSGTLAEPQSNLRELLTRALVSNLLGRRLGLPDPDAPATPPPATPATGP